jgi:DNA-binding LacI/PurR family transcriptional regulator
MLPQIETNEAKHIPVPVVTYQRQDSASVYINFEDSVFQAMEYLWNQGQHRFTAQGGK